MKKVRIFIIVIIAVVSAIEFIYAVVLTGSSFFPLNIFLLFNCIFSVIGIVSALKEKNIFYYIILGITLILFVLYRYYPFWFLGYKYLY